MKEKTTRLLIITGIIGPIFYFILLTTLGLMWEGYNPISTGMSEIGATDSPFKNTMNYFGFSLLGMFIAIFSTGFKKYFKSNLQITIAYILLVIGGIFMFSVGFLPCDSNCINVTPIGKLHSQVSTIPAILIPLAEMISAYTISKKWGKKWGNISFYLGVLSLTTGPMMFISSLNNFTGLIQRFGIGFSLFWILIISLKIYNETRT